MTSIISQIQARNLLLDDFDFVSTQAQDRITEFKKDPLVLACVLKKYLEEGKGYLSLESDSLIELITDQDIEYAEAIRKHYTKKFFWSALSNRPLSDYRRRLINLLENRITKCKDQDCGIYYKLPWFYEEDMTYEELKQKYRTQEVPNIVYGMKKSKELLDLEYLKTTVSTQRKRKIERFWFTDQTYLYGVELDQSNPLMEMFKHYLQDKHVTVEAYRTADRIDQMHYYKLHNFNFKHKKENNA